MSCSEMVLRTSAEAAFLSTRPLAEWLFAVVPLDFFATTRRFFPRPPKGRMGGGGGDRGKGGGGAFID